MTTVSISQGIRCLDACIDEGINCLFWGPPGIGKTQIVKQAAKKRKGWGIVDFRVNLRDPVDARGIPVTDHKTKTTVWYKPSELPIGGQLGPYGILLADELNTGNQGMMNVMLQAGSEHKIGEHVLDPGWAIVGTCNRLKDKALVQRMGTALKNRFLHLELVPELEAVLKHFKEIGLARVLIDFLHLRGKELLHRMPVDDTVNAFPTPRQWEEVAKVLKYPSDLRVHLVAGLVGHDCAIELEGFLAVYGKLPSLQEILNDPDNATVFPEASAKYAVVCMLERNATRANFDKLAKYVKRLGREFEALFMLNTTGDPDKAKLKLVETAAYVQWAVTNQDVHI